MYPGSKTLKILIVSLVFAASTCARAQEVADDDEMSQFLELLEQQTTLATRTRLNADYVPGMLSVLNSEQLQRRGFRIVWDALASLPGVLASTDETGMRSLSVRGIGKLFEPGKIKLLLNGEAVNASAIATTGTLFDTPVEQIERIEFIRGPGSAVHGEFAYAGVLNLITRSSGEQYSVGIEDHGGANFSALYSFGAASDDFQASLNLAASRTDGEDIEIDRDSSTDGSGYAPGPINNKRDFVSAIADLRFGDTRALLQLQQSNRGDHFGTNNLLPPDERQTVISDTLISATLRQRYRFDERLGGEWSLAALQNDTEKNDLFLGVAEAFGGLGNENDVRADSHVTERRLEASINLQYDGDRHTLFTELSANDVNVTESEQSINLDPVTKLPSPMRNEFPGPVDDSQDRGATSIVLQDEFRIADSLTLTSGLRYDNYEDIDSALSPRIALVWRRSDRHIFKTQLARAFRPPSLVETGGALESSIDPETNDTFELGYIYHASGLVVRNTVYLTELNDLIVFQDSAPFGFLNRGSSELRGYELEIETTIADDWDFVGSLSLQDDVDDELPAVAPWLLKLGLGYRLTPLTELHLQLNSAAEREREAGDPRDDFEQSSQLDAMLRSENLLGVAGLDLRLGVVNLLDEEVAYPAPAGTYPDDYPTSQGPMLWAQLRYQP